MAYSKIFCLTSYPGLCFCKRKIVSYFEHISLNRLFHYFFTCLYSPKGSIKPAKITFSMIFKRFVPQLKTDMNTAIDFAPMLNVTLFMFDLKKFANAQLFFFNIKNISTPDLAYTISTKFQSGGYSGLFFAIVFITRGSNEKNNLYFAVKASKNIICVLLEKANPKILTKFFFSVILTICNIVSFLKIKLQPNFENKIYV